jgi:hypothetical protein
MRRKNMDFVEEPQQIQMSKPMTQNSQIYDWICSLPDGATFGEAYKHFKNISPRSVRGNIADLKGQGKVKQETQEPS